MRTLKIALLATVASAALSSATLAADLIIADPVIDNTYMAPGFDWEGPYAGLWVSGQWDGDDDGDDDNGWGFGASLGVNAMLDSNLLAGVEGNLGWVGHDWQGQVHGKLGFTADTLAIYGLAGVGFNGDNGGYVPVGIGAEFAVADPLTIKAEYQYQWDFDHGDDGDDGAHVGKVGFNWHF